MSRFLIARPDFDPGTAYMYRWSECLIKEAENKGMKITDVRGTEVKKSILISKLKGIKPEIVCLNGHGDENTYSGHDFETILEPQSSDALTGSIVYVRACRSLNGLGAAAVKNGCKAFVGYSDDFVIPISNEYSATPLKDPVAKPVMEVSNLIVKQLIDGKTPKIAVESSTKATIEQLRKILYSPEYAEDIRFGQTVFALVTNSSSLGIQEQLTS